MNMQTHAAFRSDITAAVARAPQIARNAFVEMNPHLDGDERFQDRWKREKRMDAAVLLPIIMRDNGPSILFTVRSENMRSHAGQISFPGGRVDPVDNTRVDTALREAEEEVSIRRKDVDVIGTLGVHQGGYGFSVTPVVGLVQPDVHLRACPHEVSEVFEAPFDYIMNLDNHIIEERRYEDVSYRMYAAPYKDYHIWGLTAGILRNFAEYFKDVVA